MLTTVSKPVHYNHFYEDDIQIYYEQLLMEYSRQVTLQERNENIENINPSTKMVTKNKSSTLPANYLFHTSRRGLLDNSNFHEKIDQTVDIEDVSKHSHRKRKISFKIKSGVTSNRRPNAVLTTTLSANKVAQLTQKYNELIHEQPKIASRVRRANSKANDLIKTKPSVKRKPSVLRRQNAEVQSQNKDSIDVFDSPTKPKVLPKTVAGSVKATIEIFERRRSESLENNDSKPIKQERSYSDDSQRIKPKVPEKNIRKTKDLVVRDGVRKFRILQQDLNTTASNNNNPVPNDERIISKEEFKVKKEERNIPLEKLQTDVPILPELITTQSHDETTVLEVKNIPVTPPKKSKSSLYETLKLTKTTSPTQLLKMANVQPNNSFLWRSRSRDSSIFNNIYMAIEYEDLNEEKSTANQEIQSKVEENLEDLYDTVEPPKQLDNFSDKCLNISNGSSKEDIENEPKIFEKLSTTTLKKKKDVYDTVEPHKSLNISNRSSEEDEKVLERSDKTLKERKDFYDTVESSKLNISLDTFLNHSNRSSKDDIEDERKNYEKLLAKTDEILKEYKSPKILELLPDNASWKDNLSIHSYEEMETQHDCKNPKISEDIYETLSLKTGRILDEPLPKVPDLELPDSEYYNEENIYSTLDNPSSHYYNPDSNDIMTSQRVETEEEEEEIYSTVRDTMSYEPIQATNSSICKFILDRNSLMPSPCGSNRDSVISCDQQSNSIYGRGSNVGYGGGNGSELSGSDRSDDWVDVSDPEYDEKHEAGFVIIREKQRNKKNSGWSHKVRDQWTKSPKKFVVQEDDASSDTYHYYESLHSDEDFDSFDSESDDDSFTKIHQNDSGVDMGNSQLPDPPNTSSASNIYGLTKLAASAGKHMKRLRRNWSLTKNDITKSLSRMTKKKSSTNLRPPPPLPPGQPPRNLIPVRPVPPIPIFQNSPQNSQQNSYQNVEFERTESTESENNINNKNSNLNNNNNITISRKKNWLKFRRTVSMSDSSTLLQNQQNIDQNTSYVRSTFYLTNEIDADDLPPAPPPPPQQQQQQQLPSPQSVEKPPVLPARRKPRPQSPPPPAPILNMPNLNNSKLDSKLDKRTTSWYTECGLFKNTTPQQLGGVNNISLLGLKNSKTCWYAEVGLYQTSGSTPSTSSAENSGGNVGQEAYYNMMNKSAKFELDLHDEREKLYYNDKESADETKLKRHQSGDMQLLLKDEPLYQFYDAAVTEAECANETNSIESDSDYDGYEEIGPLNMNDDSQESKSSKTESPTKTNIIPPIRTRLSGAESDIIPGRTLWCEIPEVIQSEILSTLSLSQKKLQEAKFEIITSEASYLNSLTVLESHFISNLTKSTTLTSSDHQILFSNVRPVRECSERLLADLESCWQDSILLPNICSIIRRHCIDQWLDVYVHYCASQVHLDATLRRCRNSSKQYAEVLRRLEASSVCQALSLHSFLMLPMQRVTRLPLLVDAVLKRLGPKDDEYEECQLALRALNDVVRRCNEGARRAERQAEVVRISRQLDYPHHIPSVDLTSSSSTRWLVRSGDLTQLLSRGSTSDGSRLTFGKRFTKVAITLFLFEDILIVARKKNNAQQNGDEQYAVLHHCARPFVELTSEPSELCGNVGNLPPNLLLVTILENHEGRTVELLVSCATESDKQRWVEALRPAQQSTTNGDIEETVYENWDCPQVRAVHTYKASQPDELGLVRGDVVNVERKMADGWYFGQRLRDDVGGWFPANYTQEIANPHVRARNLRQRYRLLAFTGSYLSGNSNC